MSFCLTTGFSVSLAAAPIETDPYQHSALTHNSKWINFQINTKYTKVKSKTVKKCCRKTLEATMQAETRGELPNRDWKLGGSEKDER